MNNGVRRFNGSTAAGTTSNQEEIDLVKTSGEAFEPF